MILPKNEVSQYFQISSFPCEAAGRSSSSTLKHSSPTHFQTQSVVLANTIRDPSEPSMTVYLSGSYLDLKNNIYKKEAEYYLPWGNKHRWRKKRALIRTVTVLYTAFHPQIFKCFNMTVLSLFTVWETSRNCS